MFTSLYIYHFGRVFLWQAEKSFYFGKTRQEEKKLNSIVFGNADLYYFQDKGDTHKVVDIIYSFIIFELTALNTNDYRGLQEGMGPAISQKLFNFPQCANTFTLTSNYDININLFINDINLSSFLAFKNICLNVQIKKIHFNIEKCL